MFFPLRYQESHCPGNRDGSDAAAQPLRLLYSGYRMHLLAPMLNQVIVSGSGDANKHQPVPRLR
jgi:hypothetical protein